MNFDRTVRGARVVFGVGARSRVGEAVAALGVGRVVIVGTSGRRGELERLSGSLGSRVAGIFDGARQHVPDHTVARAVEALDRLGADAVLAYGGGSAIGLAKAVALERDVVVAALPTTYSGSEMTRIWGVTRRDQKTTGRDERVRPRLVVYDPELTLGLPWSVTAPSLFNALAHAAEAMYAAEADEPVLATAEESIGAIASALLALQSDARDLAGRSRALYGAHLAGTCLDGVSMGLHHKLAHVLGGSFGMPHAETHTVLLPHVLAYNREAAPEAMARIAGALGAPDAATGVWDLAVEVGAPTRLDRLGFRDVDTGPAAELVAGQPYPNPRAVEAGGVTALLRDALEGKRPPGGCAAE